jgi:hypothetical protein
MEEGDIAGILVLLSALSVSLLAPAITRTIEQHRVTQAKNGIHHLPSIYRLEMGFVYWARVKVYVSHA